MADTVLTELKIHEFDTLEQMSQYESEIGDNDLVLTPDTTAKLFLFKHAWADYLVSEMSWLRADTFSWHSGETYETAYEHLAGDLNTNVIENGVTYYAWKSDAASYVPVLYTSSETPSVGDIPYRYYNGVFMEYVEPISAVGDGYIEILYDGIATVRCSRFYGDTQADTIGDITISYYLAQDGHKICLPDQESNLVALYESTGVAWYYLLDTTNKQFKLPRTKWGFTGLRDSVGNYVPESLPNITATFGDGINTLYGTVASGAARASYSNKDALNYGGDDNSWSTKFTIDASRSSSTYKNGAPVQQRATQMYLYFYVGNFGQTAVEQTAGVTTETLNGKADIDLGNLPTNFDYIVEKQESSAENNYTWYFKFKSGWVIMGGNTNSATSTGQITCSATLPVPVKTVPTLLATPIYQSGGSVVVVTSYRSGNTIYVTLEKNTSGSASATASARWFAVGIAE